MVPERIADIVEKDVLEKSDFQAVFGLVHQYGGMHAALMRSQEEPLFERHSAKLVYSSQDGGGVCIHS